MSEAPTPAAAATGPSVGKLLSLRRFTVDDRILRDYYEGLELPEPTTGLVPSTIASDPDGSYFSEIAFANHTGHLWMSQGWTNLAPLEAGATYDVSGEIRDIYTRRDRTVVLYGVVLEDASGERVLVTEHHQSFLRDQAYAGAVELRDPGSKPGARRFEVPDGERFGGLERTITVEMCGRYFHGNANYHTDRQASAELGFRDVVVGGRMTMAYAAHILEERFGEAWWRGGSFDLKFTNPVWANETIAAHGVVTGPDPERPGRTAAFVWLAKPDGTIVLVLHASVPT